MDSNMPGRQPCITCQRGIKSWPKVAVGPLTPLRDSRCGAPHKFTPSGVYQSAYSEPYYPPPVGEPGDVLMLINAWGLRETIVGKPHVINAMLTGLALPFQGHHAPIFLTLGTYNERGELQAVGWGEGHGRTE